MSLSFTSIFTRIALLAGTAVVTGPVTTAFAATSPQACEGLFERSRDPNPPRPAYRPDYLKRNRHKSSTVKASAKDRHAVEEELIRDAIREYRPTILDADNEVGGPIPVVRDAQVPTLLRLREIPREAIAHEEQTARDYARYLEKQGSSQELLYASEVRGHNVPLFDGVILDRATRAPLANVTMKTSHHQSATLRTEIELVSSTILALLRKHRDQATRYRAMRPFGRARVFVDSTPRHHSNRDQSEWLESLSILSSLFGVFHDFGAAQSPALARQVSRQSPRRGERPVVLILDLRYEPYAFETFARPEVRQHLQRQIFERNPDADGFKVILMWNHEQVVEI